MNTVDAGVERLRHVDLNLLVALQALLEARSVTQAGVRLGLTQSAMSHSLKRLRTLFDDPLLVRGQGRMLRTPRAEQLRPQVSRLLVEVARTLDEPDGFSPQTSRRVFRLSAPDLFDMLVLPSLLASVEKASSGVALQAAPYRADLSVQLERGDLDLAVATRLLDDSQVELGGPLDPDLLQVRLFEDDFRSFVRPGHPALKRELTAPAFAALDHVMVSPTGRGAGVVDEALERNGLQRKVRLRVSGFAAAIQIVSKTDFVLTAPGAVAILQPELVALETTLVLPQHALSLLWHGRLDADPGHRWLRKQLIAATGPIALRLGR